MRGKIRVLELFAGSRSIGRVAEELGMDVLSTDIVAYPGIHVVGDILQQPMRTWKKFAPHVVWASTDCTGFSIAGVSNHWEYVNGRPEPRSAQACLSMALAMRTLEIVRATNPAVWWIENPRGMLRKMPWMKEAGKPRTVSYCQYGDHRMKPTDLWTNCRSWTPRPLCKRGDPCHEAAPRGSRTGTQGLRNAHERSKLPAPLCREVMQASLAQILGTPPPKPPQELVRQLTLLEV